MDIYRCISGFIGVLSGFYIGNENDRDRNIDGNFAA